MGVGVEVGSALIGYGFFIFITIAAVMTYFLVSQITRSAKNQEDLNEKYLLFEESLVCKKAKTLDIDLQKELLRKEALQESSVRQKIRQQIIVDYLTPKE